MDHIKKTIIKWRDYYSSEDPDLDTENVNRANLGNGKKITGMNAWQRKYLLEFILKITIGKNENDAEKLRKGFKKLFKNLQEGSVSFSYMNSLHVTFLGQMESLLKLTFLFRFPGMIIFADNTSDHF